MQTVCVHVYFQTGSNEKVVPGGGNSAFPVFNQKLMKFQELPMTDVLFI